MVNKSLIDRIFSSTNSMSYIQSTQAQGLFEFYAINIVTALTPQRLKYAYFSSKVPHARAHVTIKHKHQRFNITPYGCIRTNILQQCSPFITFIVILINWVQLVASYVVRTASLHCWGTVLKLGVTAQLSHDPLPVHYARYTYECWACLLQVEPSGCGT